MDQPRGLGHGQMSARDPRPATANQMSRTWPRPAVPARPQPGTASPISRTWPQPDVRARSPWTSQVSAFSCRVWPPCVPATEARYRGSPPRLATEARHPGCLLPRLAAEARHRGCLLPPSSPPKLAAEARRRSSPPRLPATASGHRVSTAPGTIILGQMSAGATPFPDQPLILAQM